ncbi:dipeptide epimerase [Bacillus altitudinis]|uniref:dipeptide epimerase n=1 Tax=Bacillus altitudinis TaxID=293387 RepID=UPI000762EF9C|nr:dipeptide epimerase [Bacillus altitudinis]AMB89431.1 dipeptide epimerase [Bacillus altitudinis]
MKIVDVRTCRTNVPLKKPFKTALRTVYDAASLIVIITYDQGDVSYGEAVPTSVITGETLESIDYAICAVMRPILIGASLSQYEQIFSAIDRVLVGNTSAKAAIDMAIYDGLAKQAGLPLYQYLGGYRDQLETDYTVSVNRPLEMAEDAKQYAVEGFRTLKIKVGKDDIETDIQRIKRIREKVGPDIQIRLDANQGWTWKEAVVAIRKMEAFDIELVEQPVPKEDIDGLRRVTEATDTLIMADESIFSLHDAIKVLETRSCDLINLKLMKTGGIKKALKINSLAEAYGVKCMVGSMIESKLGITAAAHLAASQPNITRYDFDAPLMLKEDLIDGGIIYQGKDILFPPHHGLGIQRVKGVL